MLEKENLTTSLEENLKALYELWFMHLTDLVIEPESREYQACRFRLNGRNIICRNAKITPKKAGQFVTFWKRNDTGLIEPFFETDPLDFYAVNVHTENNVGQFVFPKVALLANGIISTAKKEGKRGFRVYPPWDLVQNKQAASTQKWQLEYFLHISPETDLKRAQALYSGH